VNHGCPQGNASSLIAQLDRGDAQFPERGCRELRPQKTELFEFFFRAPFHEQRKENAYPAALELRIRMLHDGGNVIDGKSCVLLREATLDAVNQLPLFLRHPDIVAFSPMLVKALCSPFVVAFCHRETSPHRCAASTALHAGVAW
jgi:hypothetical protein